MTSPEKKKKLLIQAFFRFCLVFGIIAGFFLYQSWSKGDFGRAGFRLKNWFSSLQGKTFGFRPEAALHKNVRENGKTTYKSGRNLSFKNKYKVQEKQTFSGGLLTLEGKIEGDIDPELRHFMPNDSYLQEIDLSGSYCPVGFDPKYPANLRNYVYFMPRSPLFNGQKWTIFSCGGKFSCSYSVLMTERGNSIDILCSGHIGGTKTTIIGAAAINGNFDGFYSAAMAVTCENKELASSWEFHETTSVLSNLQE